MSRVPHSTIVKPSRPLAQNRRRGNRLPLQIPATLQAEGNPSAPIAVTVTEISVGGLGLQSSQSLPLGGIYQLSSFDTLLPPGMRLRLVSQQPLPEGQFKIGAQTV
jgi:hypothetical protein